MAEFDSLKKPDESVEGFAVLFMACRDFEEFIAGPAEPCPRSEFVPMFHVLRCF